MGGGEDQRGGASCVGRCTICINTFSQSCFLFYFPPSATKSNLSILLMRSPNICIKWLDFSSELKPRMRREDTPTPKILSSCFLLAWMYFISPWAAPTMAPRTRGSQEADSHIFFRLAEFNRKKLGLGLSELRLDIGTVGLAGFRSEIGKMHGPLASFTNVQKLPRSWRWPKEAMLLSADFPWGLSFKRIL